MEEPARAVSGAGTRAPETDAARPATPGTARSWSRTRLLIGSAVLFVTGVLVAGLALLVWQRTHPPHPVDDLAVTAPLRIDPPQPRAGQPVTATFRVGRQRTGPEAVVLVAAGGREDPSNTACQLPDRTISWTRGGFANFPVVRAEQLAAGERPTYRMSHTFEKPGWYFAEPVKQTRDGHWGGISNANRVCFLVQGP